VRLIESGFPLFSSGLQTANWERALAFLVLVSLAFLAGLAALNLILIHTTETFSSLSLVAEVRGRLDCSILPIEMTRIMRWIA
jgi:hypothetical protein